MTKPDDSESQQQVTKTASDASLAEEKREEWAARRRRVMQASITPRGGGGLSGYEMAQERAAAERQDRRRPADWNLWGDMPSALLGQAVALSLDEDPDQNPPAAIDCFPPDFSRRLRIAEAHVLDRTLPVIRPGLAGTQYATVGLQEFASLAKRKGWDLPERFPRPPAAAKAAAPEPPAAGPVPACAAGLPPHTLPEPQAEAATTELELLAIEPIAPPTVECELVQAVSTCQGANEVQPDEAEEEERAWAAHAADKSLNWKVRVRAQASIIWRQWRSTGGNPTPHAIRTDVFKWCVKNEVRNSIRGLPTENTLRIQVLAAKHWTPPRDKRRSGC